MQGLWRLRPTQIIWPRHESSTIVRREEGGACRRLKNQQCSKSERVVRVTASKQNRDKEGNKKTSEGNAKGKQDSTDDKEKDKEDGQEKLEEKKLKAERKRAKEKNFNPEAFDLPTAIVLGCCSFEAYNAPYRSFGVKEVSPCETETIFIDHDFLASRVEGVLEVHLRRAIGLVPPEDHDDEDGNGKKKKKKRKAPDTRCQVSIHPSAGFSDTFSQSVDPAWRRTFFLYVQNKESQSLDVSVEVVKDSEDEDNVEVGRATIANLAELCNGDIHDLALPLQRDGHEECGQVHLSVRFQAQDENHDLLRSIKGQAVGQMINDDWCFGASHEWENAADDSDWRYTGMPDGSNFAIMSDEDPIDIEGGELAEGQPLDREPWKDWTELRELVIEQQNYPSLTPIAFIMNKKSDTELWLYANWEDKKIALSFRGTSSPKDMLTDMSLDLAAFNPEGDEESKQPEEVAEEISEEEWESGPFGGMYKALKAIEKLPITHAINKLLIKTAKGKKRDSVTKGLSGWAKAQMMMLYALEHDHKWCHNGFLTAYTSVSDVVVRLVQEIMDREKDNKEAWQILLTGHSMGGALSSLCSYELSKKDYKGHKKPQITHYSFGQPRVGNAPFATAYDEAVPDSWRIKNAEDIVTTVPGLLGYTHVGNEVKLTKDGEVTVSCISSDNVREGEFIADLIPKLKEGMTGEDEEMQKEMKQLVMGEVDMMKAILKGDGVNQHMEDVYHNYLKACSRKGEDFAAPIRDAVQAAKERLQL